ncbi:hypothetical protein SAMN04487857_103247 [Pseudomonas sp. ok272]|nr:hypothetical protein SAMN04487857_103247 [Pseudomonas sp. ok272]SFM48151.1 hypothetical protein SAMN04487858_103188 [Pseudomonas sp. ok602]
MNKKKKMYLNLSAAIRRYLPLEIDPEAHGMGWAGFPCPHIRIDTDPESTRPNRPRAGDLPCHC